MVKTYLQGILLIIAQNKKANSLMRGLTVQKFCDEAKSIEGMARKYDTVRKELRYLVRDGLLKKSLPLDNMNTYSITKKGVEEIERICKQNDE